MRPTLLPLCLISCFGLPVIAGDAEPMPGRPASATAAREGWEERRRQRLESDPELKGVDLTTPEGQEKLRQVQQKRMDDRMRQTRAWADDMLAQQRREIKTEFGMGDAEFEAVEPLIKRVETLRNQRMLLDPSANTMQQFMPGRGRGNAGSRGGFNVAALLPEAEQEPSLRELATGTKALKALLADAQAKPDELTATIAKVRKARSDFAAAYAKAQEELRSVLTRRQEAILIDRGLLE